MLKRTKLIGHNDLFISLINLYKKNNFPKKIILCGNKGIGKSLFATHFVNYILSQNEKFNYNLENFEINENNKSFLLFKNSSNPNIFYISKKIEKKSIEISQIREMIKFQNRSTFNNNKKFIIIDDINNLNNSSTNALLKSIEEPNNDVFFILIMNTESPVLDTIKSRCIKFNLSLNIDNVKLVVNNYFDEDIYNLISKDFINNYNTPAFLISLIIYLKDNTLDFKSISIEELIYLIIQKKDYKKNQFLSMYITYILQVFFYKKIFLSKNITNKLKNYFYLKLNLIQKYNLDLESFFLEFQEKLLSE